MATSSCDLFIFDARLFLFSLSAPEDRSKLRRSWFSARKSSGTPTPRRATCPGYTPIALLPSLGWHISGVAVRRVGRGRESEEVAREETLGDCSRPTVALQLSLLLQASFALW